MKYFLLGITVIFFMAATPAFADCSADFAQANTFYKKGEFAQALGLYEKLIKEGRGNSALYFNAGNSYYKTGQLARALLNYERAAQGIPRDADLNTNRDVVRAKLGVSDFQPKRSFAAKVSFFLFGPLTISENTWLLSGLYFVVLLALLWAVFQPVHKKPLLILTGICVCIFIFGTVSLVEKNSLWNHEALVLVSRVPVRFEPLESSGVNFDLPEGTQVFVMETRDGWNKILRSDGKTGWMMANGMEALRAR